MPKPICITCKKPTSGGLGYLKREKKCARCYHDSKLEPYDDERAEALVQDLYRNSLRFDGSGGVLPIMRRRMRPPPGASEWRLHHVVELDSRRMKW